MPRSQYPSKRPAATQARSVAAEPVRRMPETCGITAPSSARVALMALLAAMGDARDDDAVAQMRARGHAQAADR